MWEAGEREVENAEDLVEVDLVDPQHPWRDNVFVERLWKSVKYQEVYLRAYTSMSEARASIGRYLDFYNSWRPHQGRGQQTLIRHTSTRRSQSRLRHNQGRNPLNDSAETVQINRAGSLRSNFSNIHAPFSSRSSFST